MAVIPDIACWADETASELRRVADFIAAAPIPGYLGEERVRFATLADEAEDAIDRLASDGRIDRDRCLYLFALDEEADPEAFKRAFNDARQRTDLKLPQDNNHVSCVLYVGSSCATSKRKRTLRNRLRQHLICAPTGTYALSLAKWSLHLKGGLIVRAWQYPPAVAGDAGDAAARRIVLAVEDWLAGKLQPMLGRRGSRH